MMMLTTTPTPTMRAAPTMRARASRARTGAIRPAVREASFTQRRAHTIARAEKFSTDEVLTTIADKWEETENKSTVITYAAGATAAFWLSSTLVGAINVVPLLPKVMELVGLGYSTWFVYRYVLFKDSRAELVEQVDALIARVSGEEE